MVDLDRLTGIDVGVGCEDDPPVSSSEPMPREIPNVDHLDDEPHPSDVHEPFASKNGDVDEISWISPHKIARTYKRNKRPSTPVQSRISKSPLSFTQYPSSEEELHAANRDSAQNTPTSKNVSTTIEDDQFVHNVAPKEVQEPVEQRSSKDDAASVEANQSKTRPLQRKGRKRRMPVNELYLASEPPVYESPSKRIKRHGKEKSTKGEQHILKRYDGIVLEQFKILPKTPKPAKPITWRLGSGFEGMKLEYTHHSKVTRIVRKKSKLFGSLRFRPPGLGNASAKNRLATSSPISDNETGPLGNCNIISTKTTSLKSSNSNDTAEHSILEATDQSRKRESNKQALGEAHPPQSFKPPTAVIRHNIATPKFQSLFSTRTQAASSVGIRPPSKSEQNSWLKRKPNVHFPSSPDLDLELGSRLASHLEISGDKTQTSTHYSRLSQAKQTDPSLLAKYITTKSVCRNSDDSQHYNDSRSNDPTLTHEARSETPKAEHQALRSYSPTHDLLTALNPSTPHRQDTATETTRKRRTRFHQASVEPIRARGGLPSKLDSAHRLRQIQPSQR